MRERIFNVSSRMREVASAGPNDVDRRAAYVLLEVNAGGSRRVEFVRVDYDVEEAARGILASELPHDFPEYLRIGGKPAAAHADAG